MRGEGFLIGIELSAPVAAAVAARALEAGFIVNPCTPTTVRLAPPFLLTAEQAGTFVDFLAGTAGGPVMTRHFLRDACAPGGLVGGESA